jgi:Xaa-Pro aminopeptidase
MVVKCLRHSAKEWSGTLKELEEKRAKIKRLINHHVSEHKKIDGSDTLDEQRKLRAEQAIDTLDKAHKKIDKFLKMQPQGWGKEKGQKK